MVNTHTIDASVFLNAFNRYEAGHEGSHRLLAGPVAGASYPAH
jgi:hypothetical protein